MSRVARDWAWALAVTPVQKLVLIALAERADDEGRCFPSLVHLIQMTGLARSTLAAALRELETARRIVRLRGGGRRSTRYQLLLGESDAVAMGARGDPIVAGDSVGALADVTTNEHGDGPSRARVLAGSDACASRDRAVRDADPNRPIGGQQPSGSRTPAVRETDPSRPTGGLVRGAVVRPADPSRSGGGLQQFDGRTPAVWEADPSRPTGGPVREPAVRQADPSRPRGGHQPSGGRTAAVRETDPNRQDNRHVTVSESNDDGVDAPRHADQVKDAPKASPIPADWCPSGRVFAWATKQGMTRDWVEAQIDEFVVYWTDTGAVRQSWDATFINRLQALRTNQAKDLGHDTEPRLADKDYLTGATPLDQIPWLRPVAGR